eukprot:scaffold26962_cov114-Isochrysis_galbana.AAC.2
MRRAPGQRARRRPAGCPAATARGAEGCLALAIAAAPPCADAGRPVAGHPLSECIDHVRRVGLGAAGGEPIVNMPSRLADDFQHHILAGITPEVEPRAE